MSDNPTTTMYLWAAHRRRNPRPLHHLPRAVHISVIHQMQREMVAIIDARRLPTSEEVMYWQIRTGGTLDKISEIFVSFQEWRKREPFAEYEP